jgi:hypothetical protein
LLEARGLFKNPRPVWAESPKSLPFYPEKGGQCPSGTASAQFKETNSPRGGAPLTGGKSFS